MDCSIYVVTAQMICIFDFASAKSRFSGDADILFEARAFVLGTSLYCCSLDVATYLYMK